MTKKGNALRTIRFQEPEYVMTWPPEYRLAYLGCNLEGYNPEEDRSTLGVKWRDVWGVGFHKEQEGVMAFPREHPLADLPAALRTYPWPSPDDERIVAPIYRRLAEKPDDVFLFGSHRSTLWERAYKLVGMEDLMCYFYTEPEAVKELLHRIMDFQVGISRHYLKVGIEFAGLGDDMGTQLGPLFSRDMLEEFFVPEYRRLFETYKERGILIGFHSCGNVVSVLETFIGLGVDVLNPVQATANDLGEVRRITQGRMALAGGISSGMVMQGPEERIRLEVAKRVWQLGRQGGYFCSSDQGMPYPEAHVKALYDAVGEFGTYPLRRPGGALLEAAD